MRAVGKAHAARDALDITDSIEEIALRLGLPASARSAIEEKMIDEAAIAGVAVIFSRRK
jgi:hypothetical protein